MGILLWLVVGAVAGMVAFHQLTGQREGYVVIVVLLGTWGALCGGWIATKLGYGSFMSLNLVSVVGAATGAAVVLLVHERVALRHSHN